MAGLGSSILSFGAKNSSEVSIAFAPKRGSAKLIDCFAQAGILNDLDCSIENSAMIN
jgi:hypothetical protein